MKQLSVQIAGEIHLEADFMKVFKTYATFIETLFSAGISTVSIQGVRKVVVELLDIKLYADPNLLIIVPAFEGNAICTIKRAFDFSLFLQGNDLEKKTILLDILTDSLVKLSSEFGWNVAPFIQARDRIKKSDFENWLTYDKPKKSKNREWKAVVEINQGLSFSSINISFFNASDNLFKRVEVIKTLPHPYLYSRLLGKTKWLGNSCFMLSARSGEIHFAASLDKDTVDVSFTPEGRDTDGVKEELRFICYGEPPYWL